MFNVKVARFVKTSDTEAIVVMPGVFKLGEIKTFEPDEGVIVLYSSRR